MIDNIQRETTLTDISKRSNETISNSGPTELERNPSSSIYNTPLQLADRQSGFTLESSASQTSHVGMLTDCDDDRSEDSFASFQEGFKLKKWKAEELVTEVTPGKSQFKPIQKPAIPINQTRPPPLQTSLRKWQTEAVLTPYFPKTLSTQSLGTKQKSFSPLRKWRENITETSIAEESEEDADMIDSMKDNSQESYGLESGRMVDIEVESESDDEMDITPIPSTDSTSLVGSSRASSFDLSELIAPVLRPTETTKGKQSFLGGLIERTKGLVENTASKKLFAAPIAPRPAIPRSVSLPVKTPLFTKLFNLSRPKSKLQHKITKIDAAVFDLFTDIEEGEFEGEDAQKELRRFFGSYKVLKPLT